MIILTAKEHGPIPLLLTDETLVRRDVLRRAYVSVREDRKSWDLDDSRFGEVSRALFAGSLAGLLPLTADTAVLVEPRFPANLTHMVNALGHPTIALDIARSYATVAGDQVADWMIDHLSGELVDAVEAVTRQGLLRGYVERREVTTSPKGRLNVGATLTHHVARGIDYRADVSFYERTEENAPNQALVEALHWVRTWTERRPKMKAVWRRTHTLLHLLRYVPRDREGRFKRDRLVRHPLALPETRSTYRRALPLALALLERRGFSLDAAQGDLALSSLLVKTDDVFEKFVLQRLREMFPDPGLTVVDGNTMARRRLYEPPHPHDVPNTATVLTLSPANIQPDILIEDDSGTRLVIDVKYKPIKDHADREDVIEQLVTYAHRLDCPRALSIHPTREGQAPGLFVSGRIGSTTLYNYRVDLGADNLDTEMHVMASALATLC